MSKATSVAVFGIMVVKFMKGGRSNKAPDPRMVDTDVGATEPAIDLNSSAMRSVPTAANSGGS